MNTLSLRDGPHDDDLWLHRMDGLPGISLTFQAIVDLATGVAAGYEVLARVEGVPRAAADRWLAAASELELGAGMEAAIWRAAFEVRDALPSAAFLSINAGADFLASGECEGLAGSRDSLDGLVIEVTEQEAITDYDRLSATLSRYRSRGASVAVDGAGAGYASMSHILALRPEFIKLDRAIVADCDRDAAKASLIEMLRSFAGRTGSRLIAEGVETAGELATLADIGVPLGQGSFLARPQPECSSPSEGASGFLRRRARPSEGASLRPLVEHVPTAPDEGEAYCVLGTDPRAAIVVVTGEAPQSLSLMLREGNTLSLRPGAMQVDPGREVGDVLSRAMAREAASRFDPIVCAGSDGEILGILRIERLVEYLVDHGCNPGVMP